MLVLIGLVISVWLLVQTTPVQNFLVHEATKKLSNDLHTKVRIKHVNFALFNSMLLEGTLIEDLNKDTLLYAGSVRVNITDWFFFKDKIELSYIGLQDATVFLNRTDSVWNYDFLINYFSGPQKAQNKKNIDLNLRTIELVNILLVQQDRWRGEDMRASIKRFDLSADEMNFNKRLMRINTINMQSPYFAINDYPGKRRPRVQTENEPDSIANDPNNLRWNPANWHIAINKLSISNGAFTSDRQTNRAPYPYFDAAHIFFKDITGSFTDCTLEKDSITARVSLSTNERSGLVVKKLSADLTMHPEAMQFEQLDLRTDRSQFRDFFAMRYTSFENMEDFITRVRMEGRFNNAVISSDDIAYFAPEIGHWKKQIKINGIITGSVDDLNGKNLVVSAGKDTHLRGNLSMAGLPDINKTYIDFEAENFKTNYNDAVHLIPRLKSITQPRLDALEYIRFRGNFTGFISDFVTYGSVETALGTLVTDLNMKFPDKGPAGYSGNVRTAGLQIGKLIGNNSIGSIIFQGKVNGSGLDAASLNAELDGNIQLLEFNDYPYRGLTVKGKVSKRLFNGELVSEDPNLKAKLNGLVDFSKDIPEFNFFATITRAQLRTLNLMKDSVDFFGKFQFNFKGNNFDNFLGTARVYDASLFKSGRKISFDSLYIESKIIDSNKVITAVSNEFDAALAGEFSINDLPVAFQSFLNKYYPAYIKPTKKLLTNEIFSFVITTRNIDEYVNLIHPELSGLNNSTITGRINTKENLLDLNADIPQVSYRNINVYDLKLKATGAADRLLVESNIANVYINDSLNFPGTAIRINSARDISDISVRTSANQTLNSANIVAQVQTLPEGGKIKFRESDFDINGKKWVIEKDGELTLAKNIVSAQGIKLHNGLQEVLLTTVPSATGGVNDIKIQLQNVNIGDFTPYLVKSNRLEGLLSGTINIGDPFGKLRVDVNAETEQFRLDDDSVGRLVLKGKYYGAFREANFTASSDNQNYKFDLQGIINLGDSTKKENIDIFTTMKNTKIDILQRYLDGVFTDVTGFATGGLRITGPSNALNYIGSIHLSDAGMKVKYTNVYYKIPFANVEMKEDRIDFGNFSFVDNRNNRAQVTKGILYHRGFDDLAFDFAVNTNKLVVLATGNNGTDPFYGNVVAKANVTLKGPLEDMVMNVVAEPADSSNLFINVKTGKTSGQADFVVWKVYGREMETVNVFGQNVLTVNLDVTANNYANMNVILDELTGDIIKATGRGNLKMRATTDGEFSITGRYEIDRGNYNFNFESLLKKPFKLREGVGNYIQWTGDPNTATIKVDAEYEAENVSFTDLGLAQSNLGLNESAAGSYRGKIIVIASLSEQLYAPKIVFDISLPPNSRLSNDFYAQAALDLVKNDANELNRQVAFLVVFNSFGPMQSENQGSLGNAAFEGIVVSSISGVLSSTLSRQFSSAFQKVFNDKSIKVNFNAQLYSGNNIITGRNNNPFNLDRTNLNLSVGKSLFNERLTFTFGSAVDFGLSNAQVAATAQGDLPFLPDVNAEWKITPDGKLVLTFFYRDSYSYFAQSNAGFKQNRTGASISYRRDFEKAGNLLTNRKKKAKKNDKAAKTAAAKNSE